MKRCALTVFLTLAVLTVISAQDMAVATVRLERTEPVSGRQLDQTVQAIEQQQGRSLTPAEKKEVLNQLIDQILVIQAAEADRSVTVSDEEIQLAGMRLLSQQLQAVGAIPAGAELTDPNQYRQVIEQQGLSVQEFETTVKNQLLAEKYITSVNQTSFQNIGPATEAELSAEYQRRISEFAVSDSLWFNHIFFNTTDVSPQEARAKGERAREVHRQLMNTRSTFAELVSSESEDEVSKTRGGLIGPVMKGDYVAEQLYGPEFMNTLFSMDVGETSPVLQSNVGYHIVQISEKKAAQLLPGSDAEVKSYLQQVIYASKYQQAFEAATLELLTDLRGRATINYFGDYQ